MICSSLFMVWKPLYDIYIFNNADMYVLHVMFSQTCGSSSVIIAIRKRNFFLVLVLSPVLCSRVLVIISQSIHCICIITRTRRTIRPRAKRTITFKFIVFKGEHDQIVCWLSCGMQAQVSKHEGIAAPQILLFFL